MAHSVDINSSVCRQKTNRELGPSQPIDWHIGAVDSNMFWQFSNRWFHFWSNFRIFSFLFFVGSLPIYWAVLYPYL